MTCASAAFAVVWSVPPSVLAPALAKSGPNASSDGVFRNFQSAQIDSSLMAVGRLEDGRGTGERAEGERMETLCPRSRSTARHLGWMGEKGQMRTFLSPSSTALGCSACAVRMGTTCTAAPAAAELGPAAAVVVAAAAARYTGNAVAVADGP